MGLNEVIGHEAAKKILENSVRRQKVSHAYIFEGAAGVGRLSLAKAFAEMLVGGKVGINPDIIVVTNELYNSSKKKTNSISIETVRAMKADVYIRPYSGDRKVYIIPNADTMLEPAQNSLLKVFEEPPEYCTIILTASNSNLLLQTIRSRAQFLRLNPLDSAEVEGYLKNNGTDAETAKALSVMSGGSIGKALGLSMDGDAVSMRSEVIGHLMTICDGRAKELYDFIKFLKQNKSSVQLILDVMSDWSSDILHIKMGGDILNADKKDELKKFSSRITNEAALRFGEIVAKYSLALGRNANYPIAVQCLATEYWEEIHGRNYRSAL